MKTHLLASLLLSGSPLLACDASEAAPAVSLRAPKDPLAKHVDHHAKAPVATRPAPTVAPTKSAPMRTARPAYLFM